MSNTLRHSLPLKAFSLLGAAFSPFFSHGVAAQASLALEEVTVTAQKREDSLQDTPISLVAFDQGALEKMGISSLDGIAQTVPNLDMRQTTNGSAGARIFIRGVGVNDHVATLDGAVGVYLDGVYIARNTGLAFEITDLERIEVLRGPQGSLWGRNTSGGAISLIGKKPSGELRLKQVVEVGNYGHVRTNTQLDLPRVGDFSAKLSALYDKKDGWVENRGNGVDFGESESSGARFALRWTPAETFTADYVYDYAHAKYGSAYYQPITPFYPAFSMLDYSSKRQDKAYPGHNYDYSRFSIDGHTLTLEWNATENTTFKSISAYRQLRQDNYADNGANPVYRLYANDPYDVNQDQFSQEFQILGDLFEKTFVYTAGLYYFEEKAHDFGRDYATVPIPDPFELQIGDRDLNVKNSASAVFGSGTWTPAMLENRLHLTGGFRLSTDHREIELNNKIPNFSADADHGWRNFSPSFTVAYDVADASNIYLKYAEGYRTGGYNGRATSVEKATTPVDEETLTTYEVGYKSEWFDHRLRFNGAVFTSNYDDMQLTLLDTSPGAPPGATNYVNAGEARLRGLELELTAALTEGLTFRGSFARLLYDFKEVIDPISGFDVADDFLLVGAPKTTWNADLEYGFPSQSWGRVSADINYSWKDESEIASLKKDAGGPMPSYGLWNARLTLSDMPVSDRSNLAVALWVKNLTDKEYQTDGFELLQTAGTRLAAFGEPRTFGLEVTYNFQ
jgi:iron complex outermembrane receptor protein